MTEISVNFSWVDLLLVSPAFILFLASLVPLVMKLFNRNQEPSSFAVLSAAWVGLILSFGLMLSLSSTHRIGFDGALIFDGLSSLMGLVVVAVSAMVLVFSRENLSTNHHQFSEHVFLLLNSTVGMLLVIWAHDLMTFFIGMELMSLCLYVLIAMSSEARLSKEAALKYFILGSMASALLLYGIAFIFGTAGSTNLIQLTENAKELMGTHRLFLVGLIFSILGLCFKVSIFPFHAWTPDVYQGAPTPVTAFMATGVKSATLVLFLRLLQTEAFSLDPSSRFLEVLQWLAAFTMLGGNVAAVMQQNMKRMLAYSSVAHSGYILMGLIVTALSGEDILGSSSVIFYLISYSLMTLGAFGVMSVLEKKEDSLIYIEDLRGFSRRHPWLAGCLTLILLSLGGIPPTIGFFAKFFIFSAALKAHLIWLTLWAVISSVIGVYYYLRPIVMMYMREAHEGEGVCAIPDRFLSFGVVSLSALLILILGLISHPLYQYVVETLIHT